LLLIYDKHRRKLTTLVVGVCQHPYNFTPIELLHEIFLGGMFTLYSGGTLFQDTIVHPISPER